MHRLRRKQLGGVQQAIALLLVSALPAMARAKTFVTVTPNDDLTSIIESASDDTVISLTAGTFNLAAHPPFNQAILITNKSKLKIKGQGPGQTRLQLPSNVQFGFYTGSNVSDLTIEGLHLKGTLPLATNTHAIGNYSGTTNVHDVTFTNLRVSNTAVGISADTSISGVFDNVTITNNEIHGTVGRDPGWGYGIEITNPTNVIIANNLIKEATRHSIYVARSAVGSNVRIEHNTILNHDPDGMQRLTTGRWYLAALAIARANDVDVAFNRIVNPHTIALSIEPDEIHGWPTQNINLVGNEIIDARYVGIWAVTGSTHNAIGNTISHLPNPDADDNGWGEKISFFNFATGKPTDSRLLAPDPRWSNVDFITDLNRKIYVMHDGTLDRILSRKTWRYDTSSMDWSGIDSLIPQPTAGGDGLGRLDIARDGMVFQVHPQNWSVTILGDTSIPLDTGGPGTQHDEHQSIALLPGPHWSATIGHTDVEALATIIDPEGKTMLSAPEPGSGWAVLLVAAWIVRRGNTAKTK